MKKAHNWRTETIHGAPNLFKTYDILNVVIAVLSTYSTMYWTVLSEQPIVPPLFVLMSYL